MTRYWGEDAAVMGRRILSGIDRWQVRKLRGTWCVFEPGPDLRYIACLNWDEAMSDADERSQFTAAGGMWSPSMDEAGRELAMRVAALARVL